MDLKTFVSETLTQIVEGVADAQKRIQDAGFIAAVNPQSIDIKSSKQHGSATPVEFDVAVFAGEEAGSTTGSKAKGSVSLISVVTARLSGELESKASGAHKNETTSRIKFTVQLAQPGDFSRYSYDPGGGRVTRVV